MVKIKLFMTLSLSMVLFSCCKYFTMEPSWGYLKLINSSGNRLQTMININYPDTSLNCASMDGYVDGNDYIYIANHLNLKDDKYIGYTIFLFKIKYFDDNYNGNVCYGDNGLDSTKLIKKWVLTRAEMDSVGWKLNYPDD